jgi:superfamily II DNA/RNA helicase
MLNKNRHDHRGDIRKRRYNPSKNRGWSQHKRNRNSRGGRKTPTFDPSKFINTNPVETTEEKYVSKHTFSDFALDERLVKIIHSLNINVPTPIQDQIIPEILKNRDVVGLAETGTGKTAAFLIPLIQKTLRDKQKQTLILAPTRELAIQIEQEFRELSRGLHLFSTVCVGGMNINNQIRFLRKTNHFVIATPGRIIDLINRKSFNSANVSTVVLDEADRMLDMGFIHDMKKILSQVPKNREVLFFSATLPAEAKKIINDFLDNPISISVKKKDISSSIEQNIVQYGHHNKFETLLNLLQKNNFNCVIVFGSMKHSVERLSGQLSKSGIQAISIHGNKNHGQRQRALKSFKEGKSKVLVATDVAARGIHVDNVSHVINYDLPATFEDYIHRIGRTGRSGKYGKALTFVLK